MSLNTVSYTTLTDVYTHFVAAWWR